MVVERQGSDGKPPVVLFFFFGTPVARLADWT